ncbi:MAG: class I SAM-dependent methyltransferase [Betaproteobacteria bacterium]|nr:class I SAM-dependent methyltransferase [Betaproteobacteria bacterium]
MAALGGRESPGIDIDASAIAHARLSYAAVPNVRFDEGSAASLPLPDVRVDAVVSFETIEHLPRAYQPRMPAVIARARQDGVRILLFGAACTKTQLQARGGAVVPRSSAVLVRRELVVDAPA